MSKKNTTQQRPRLSGNKLAAYNNITSKEESISNR